ncbi:transposase [Pandoraea fibrosis]|uniref:Transposase n=1 Tax=Pandoraea fibrosis TaxID=1891094 RepID=A0A5E4W9H6_9BURK|nr:transposase [Pandoraea fibrosis]
MISCSAKHCQGSPSTSVCNRSEVRRGLRGKALAGRGGTVLVQAPRRQPYAGRRASTLSCGCPGSWRTDGRGAGGPPRRPSPRAPALCRCRHACPSARSPARFGRRGSSQPVSQPGGAPGYAFERPSHSDARLTSHHLDLNISARLRCRRRSFRWGNRNERRRGRCQLSCLSQPKPFVHDIGVHTALDLASKRRTAEKLDNLLNGGQYGQKGVPIRRYTDEFRVEAARPANSVGHNEAARHLGVPGAYWKLGA